VATPIGRGPGFELPSLSRAVRRSETVAALRCSRAGGSCSGAHLELFARRRVLIVPAGIGVAPPRHGDGARIAGGRCRYPAVTLEPTGVIEVAAGAQVTLGQLFALWGQPLGRTRIAGFRGRVAGFVGGRRWRGDIRAIPLARHAQIVLEVGGFVPPHRTYLFPKGL
jgi:hypothetical protein